MEMWNCDEVDKIFSAVWGFGISGIKRLVSARLSEIYLHPKPYTLHPTPYTLYPLRQLLLSEFLFVAITQKYRSEVKPSMQPV